MIELDKIYNIDCIEGMKMIEDNSVDAIICDLPYGTTANEWDTIIPFDELWGGYLRIAKPSAPIILFGCEPFTTKLRMSNFDMYRYDWIWVKSMSVGFLHANKRPLRTFENIAVFYRTLPTYNPQGIVEYNKIHRRGSVGNNYNEPTSNDYIQKYTNYPTDILYFGKDSTNYHPTQKPLDLIRYLVRTYTNEGDTVLDNCMGSGTTAVASIKENRHFIGFETNKEYFDKANKRINAERQQMTFDFNT